MRYKLLLILIVGSLLGGCRTSRQIVAPATRLSRDSVACMSQRVDTVIEKDSVSVTVETRRDTVYRTEYRERVRWRVSEKTDTVTVERRDSVVKPLPLEKHPSASDWEKAKTAGTGCLVGMALCVALYAIWRWRSGGWK